MMYKNFIFILFLIFMTGCATGRARGVSPGLPSKVSAPIKPSDDEKVSAEADVPAKGIVFAKTVFEGVLKTSYVRLTIVSQAAEKATHYLYIGDQARQQGFPWVPQTVNPDYFIIELPPGEYRITEIAIPVGTSLAQETVDITFSVVSAKAAYLGTLRAKGTKERIRFGGVPVIQPGFDYEMEIADDRAVAIPEFQKRVPQFNGEINVNLMTRNPLLPVGLSSSHSAVP